MRRDSDIVVELRLYASSARSLGDRLAAVVADAADEIETLRDEVARLRSGVDLARPLTDDQRERRVVPVVCSDGVVREASIDDVAGWLGMPKDGG